MSRWRIMLKIWLWLQITLGQTRAKRLKNGPVVVAQMVEHSLRPPEVRGLNPVIGKRLYRTCVYCQTYWLDENKEKEAGKGPIKMLKTDCLRFDKLLFVKKNVIFNIGKCKKIITMEWVGRAVPTYLPRHLPTSGSNTSNLFCPLWWSINKDLEPIL